MCIVTHLECFFKSLTETYNFKSKDVGEPSHRLGGDVFHDQDRILAPEAASYVNKMVANYEVMLEQNQIFCAYDCEVPELNLTLELDEKGIKQY
jgi:hypothetical protein